MKTKILAILLVLIFSVTSFAQLDRSKQPKPGPAPEINLGQYQSFTLDNGLRVIVVENHKIPKITFRMEFVRDPILEGDHMGYISMAGQLLRTGTKKMTKSQIDEAIDFMGASLFTGGQMVYGSSLTKHFDKLFSIISDIVLTPDFKQEELDKIKKKTLSGLQAAKEQPSAIATNLRKSLFYGKDYPYGEVETEKTVNSITLQMCKDYYTDYFRPNIAILALVGDINVDQAKKMVAKYLGGWKKKDVPHFTYKTPKAPFVRKVAFVDRPTSVQSVVQVGYPVELKKGSEDVIKAKVMNTILGGSFSSRLNKNLREDKGYTYGAGSSLASDRLVGYFDARCTVRNSVTDSSVSEILKEMKKIRNNKVSEKELQSVKNYLTGSFSRSLERPQTMATFALNIEKYNLPKDYYKNYLKKLNAVTIEEVQKMAKKYIKPNNAYVMIVGKASEEASKMKKFSVSGKVGYYDIYGNKYDPSMKNLPKGVTAESILDKYITAIGGRDNLMKVKDKVTVLRGGVQGMKIKIEIKQKAPNKLYQMVDFGTGTQKTIFDGKKAKTIAMGQEKEVKGDMLEVLKIQANLYLPLDYKKYNITATLSGMEKVNGKDAIKVTFKAPTGKTWIEYFDKDSGLKVKQQSTISLPQGSFTQVIEYKDYKDVNGVKYPFKLIQSMGPQKIEMDVESIKVNTGINDNLFKIK